MNAAFYGSSTIAGVGLQPNDQRFTTILAQEMGMAEVNLGVASSVVTGRDLDAQIVSQQSGVVRVPDIFESDPALVVVLYGYDDMRQEKPLGDLGDFRPGTFASDFDSMVRGIAGGCVLDRIVVMTLEFVEPDGAEGASGPYNEVIRKIAARYGLRLFDAAAIARSNAGSFIAPMEPPFALSAEGHRILAREMARFLQTTAPPHE